MMQLKKSPLIPRTKKITRVKKYNKHMHASIEMNQMLEWSDKGFKATIIKMIQ